MWYLAHKYSFFSIYQESWMTNKHHCLNSHAMRTAHNLVIQRWYGDTEHPGFLQTGTLQPFCVAPPPFVGAEFLCETAPTVLESAL